MADDGGLRIGILGAMQASRAGTALPVRGRRITLLLAVLAMSARLPVHADRLADLLWPEKQPEHVLSSLHTTVARLRLAVGPGAVVTAPGGYLLDIDPDAVDLLRFRRLVQAAREADGPDVALRLLDQALGLWRGEPLEGLQSAGLGRDLVPGLIDERLAAAEMRADIELEKGLHDRVISEFFGLTRQYPLREPLWGRLITALAGTGRSAEAIQQYHEARKILADELGVDPSAELQELYQQLLQPDERSSRDHDHAGVPMPASRQSGHQPDIPRQLPPRISGFKGRAADLRALSELANEAAAGTGTTVIAAVGGMAGAGKSALAVHWAHQVADLFPGGQLYADLRGFAASGEPAAPAEVIRVFLEALGEPPSRIPASLEAREARYRTLMTGRRVLVVLDNASNAAQVRPLLPAAVGCMAVITSRRALVPLAAEYGARLLGVDPLSKGEAAELLSARLSATRAADEQTVAEIVAGCGRLPLALAVIAARAATRPALPLAAYAAELSDPGRRLDALETGDPSTSVRAAFSRSCLQLSDPARELYRLLGLHPGPDISVSAAASLAGTAAGAAAALDELAMLHLLTEHSPGRYVLHDLVRAHAAEQAVENMRPPERGAASRRMLDHYLHTARDADAIISPLRHPFPLSPPADGAVPEPIRGHSQATEWFDAEREVLIAVTALADRTGRDAYAWQIPWAIAGSLDRRGCWQDWQTVMRLALDAAYRLGDPDAQARIKRSIGHLQVKLGSYRDACDSFRQALDLYSDLGDLVGQARVHGDLSSAFAGQQRYQEALAHSRRAVDLTSAGGPRHVHADALNKAGWDAAHLGDYGYALTCCRRSLEIFSGLSDRYSEAFVRDSLGYIHEHLGDHAESIECFRSAVNLFAEYGNRYELSATLANLGDACQAAGRQEAACDAWEQALDVLEDLQHPDAARIRARLHFSRQTQ